MKSRNAERRLAPSGQRSVSLLTIGALLMISGAAVAQGQMQRSAFVSVPVKPKKSVPARDVPRTTARTTAETPEGLDWTASTTSTTSPVPWADPVVQNQGGSIGETLNELTAPLTQFAGQNGGTPPDTVGDVGPNHYVQMVNSTFQVWDKQGNTLAGPSNINSLWAGQGGECQTENAGDPIVLYDQQANRWMLSQFTSPRNAPFSMCIAYSQTADPTGAYHLYEFVLPASHDYMKYGIWPDGLYMSTWEGGGNGAYVFDRASMLNGAAATFQYFTTDGSGGPRGQRILPSDWDGARPPPAGAPNYFARSIDGEVQGGSDRIEIWEFHTDWQDPSNSTFTLVTNLTPAGFSIDLSCADTDGDGASRNCIAQPGTTMRVDDLANRLLHRLQYRNFGSHEAMVVNQTVDAGSDRAGVRWYEFRKTGSAWTIHQQGTYAPGTTANRWMGSAAMDGAGNIAIGYSITDATNNVFPSIAYTGRLASAPLGLMPEPEMTLFTGTASQTNADRWGDYSALTVDPVDDCTFWYTQQHSGNRATRIGSFRFNSCVATDLSITKTDSPDPIVAGEVLEYTITVTNNGPTGATNVVVTDTLPAGVVFLSSSSPCTGGATRTCSIGNIASGASTTLLIQVRVPSSFVLGASGGTANITNTATVAADQPDTNSSNNSATAVTQVRSSADLRVTKVCKPDETATAGTSAFCDIHVDNLGPSDAANVVLEDTITSDGSFTISAITASPSGSCTPPAPVGPTSMVVVNCNLGTEPAGDRTTVRVTFSSTGFGDVNDFASVGSSTSDPDTSNNSATGRVSFTASADVFVTKTASPNPVTAGTQLTYLVTVGNAGPSTASGVVLKDILPAGTTVVSVSPSTGSCVSGVPGDPLQPTTCTLGNFANGASATVTIVVKVDPDRLAGSLLFNQATVSSSTADPENGNNSVSTSTTVRAEANLQLTKALVGQPVAGTVVSYRHQVTNAGPSNAQDVTLRDALPPQLVFQSAFRAVGGAPVGAPLPCQLVAAGSNEWSCPLGEVPAGTGVEILVNVLIRPDVPQGTSVSNTASVISSTPDPTPAVASAGMIVQTVADLKIVKTSDADVYKPTSTIKYTITVTNLGPSDAQTVVVKDNLPPVKQALYKTDNGGCSLSGLTLTCPMGTVGAGQSRTFDIYELVRGNKGTVTNVASVTTTTSDPVASNNTSTRNALIKGGP